MFGGLDCLLNGKMFAGMLMRALVVRVGPETNDQALKEPHARPMDFTGRSMTDYLYVGQDGTTSAAQWTAWLTGGLEFATGLQVTKQKVRRRRG
jgi:TfoX/Sxy family transcriptional regulator of competence genes